LNVYCLLLLTNSQSVRKKTESSALSKLFKTQFGTLRKKRKEKDDN